MIGDDRLDACTTVIFIELCVCQVIKESDYAIFARSARIRFSDRDLHLYDEDKGVLMSMYSYFLNIFIFKLSELTNNYKFLSTRALNFTSNHVFSVF